MQLPEALSPCGCVWPKNAFRHDGFYERVGFGIHYASYWGDGPYGPASIATLATGVSGAFGGTPWDGLVVAGMVSVASGSGTFNGGPPGAPGRASILVPFLGAVVDWYPNPRGGWHTGGRFGLGGYSAHDSSNDLYAAIAPAGAVFAGGSGWMGPQWSSDLMLVASLSGRVSARNQGNRDPGYTFMGATLGLEFAFLYH